MNFMKAILLWKK